MSIGVLPEKFRTELDVKWARMSIETDEKWKEWIDRIPSLRFDAD